MNPQNFSAREQSLLVVVCFGIAFYAFLMFYAHSQTTEMVLHAGTFRRAEEIKKRWQEAELDARCGRRDVPLAGLLAF